MQVAGVPRGWLPPQTTPSPHTALNCSREENQSEDGPGEADLHFKEELESQRPAPGGRARAQERETCGFPGQEA